MNRYDREDARDAVTDPYRLNKPVYETDLNEAPLPHAGRFAVPQPVPAESFSPPVDAHPMSRKFYTVLAEAARLHDKKQKDYGSDVDPFANVRASEDFGIPAWLGCIIRGNDKVRRIQSFATRGELANESIEDALIDLLVYAGIALVLYRESL